MSCGKLVAFNNKNHKVDKVATTMRKTQCFWEKSWPNTGLRSLCIFSALDVGSERACKYNTNVAQTLDSYDVTLRALAKWGYLFCAQLYRHDCTRSLRWPHVLHAKLNGLLSQFDFLMIMHQRQQISCGILAVKIALRGAKSRLRAKASDLTLNSLRIEPAGLQLCSSKMRKMSRLKRRQMCKSRYSPNWQDSFFGRNAMVTSWAGSFAHLTRCGLRRSAAAQLKNHHQPGH